MTPHNSNLYTDPEMQRILDEFGPNGIDDARLRCLCFLPGRYYGRIYILPISPKQLPPHGGDLMGWHWRRDDQPLIWHMRFRYRRDAGGGPWDGRDQKEFIGIPPTPPCEEEAMRALMAGLTRGLAERHGGGKFDTLIIDGNANRAMELLRNPATRPKWMHTQVVEPGELPPGMDPLKYVRQRVKNAQN